MGRKKKKSLNNEVSANKNISEKAGNEINRFPDIILDPESKASEGGKADAQNSESNIPLNGNKELELHFETYHPNIKRVTGRVYFVHSLCQVCKEELGENVACPKCKMVRYCTQEHRRQHWPEHAELCAATLAVCKQRGVPHIMHSALHMTPQKFRVFRFQNMVDCENKVERPLEKWEREMFIFPNVCGSCYEYKTENLTICNRCSHSGFCKGHETENHDQWCSHLLRYKSVVRDQFKYGIACLDIPNCKIPSVLPKLVDINHFFRGIINDIDEFQFLELSEITTYPLTVIHALQGMDKQDLLKSKILTIHVIGAESDFEINKLEKWEYYVLHLIPELKSLNIEFIGPELNTSVNPGAHKMCKQCVSTKKSITFKFHTQLYHTLCKKQSFSKPNLICAFNPGLYRATGFNGEDTWNPTIASMIAQNCPILTTAYTQKEILLDVERVKSTRKICLKKEPTLNPFSSSKPSLNFVSEEDSPVIFKNQFYCVMCNS